MRKNYKDLAVLASKVKEQAYAPYSNFKVGAVLITNKNIYYGANIENSSYSLSMCAERVAIFKAVADGNVKGDFLSIILNGNTINPICPCGACLQVMNEFFNQSTDIVLSNENLKLKVYKITDLLPLGFGDLF